MGGRARTYSVARSGGDCTSLLRKRWLKTERNEVIAEGMSGKENAVLLKPAELPESELPGNKCLNYFAQGGGKAEKLLRGSL